MVEELTRHTSAVPAVMGGAVPVHGRARKFPYGLCRMPLSGVLLAFSIESRSWGYAGISIPFSCSPLPVLRQRALRPTLMQHNDITRYQI
jgi:hypothetical protein